MWSYVFVIATWTDVYRGLRAVYAVLTRLPYVRRAKSTKSIWRISEVVTRSTHDERRQV